jgi:hypothetical protein
VPLGQTELEERHKEDLDSVMGSSQIMAHGPTLLHAGESWRKGASEVDLVGVQDYYAQGIRDSQVQRTSTEDWPRPSALEWLWV